MTCGKCGGHTILPEPGGRYCLHCGNRGQHKFIDERKEKKRMTPQCKEKGCDLKAWVGGYCRKHQKAKELEGYVPFSDPETGNQMSVKVSETYRYDRGNVVADITIAKGEIAGLEIHFDGGDTWTPPVTDLPALMGLFEEVGRLTR